MSPAPMKRYDDYAEHRCECGHLQYANQEPGGNCQFCACSDHRARGAT